MNEETFLAALHESPNDEVTWLALAAWPMSASGSPRVPAEALVLQSFLQAVRRIP
jgi:hypothetical protein